MCTQPMIFPFDFYGRIYVLQDENGNTIGTGSREVCGLLLYLIKKAASPFDPEISYGEGSQTNIHAAMTI